MRKFLISIAAAASVLAIATPASAQYYGGYGYGYNNGYGHNYGRAGYESRRLIALNQQRLAKLHRNIRQYVAEGRLDPREAAQLDREVARFGQELRAVAQGGMTGREGAIFDARADRIGQEIQARAGVRYGYGYGYSYDRYGRW